jgi:hypothetical protein
VIEGEWRLVYPGVNYSFGARTLPVFNATTPELGEVELQTADANRPYADGRNFGTDTRSGRTISFDLGALHLTDETAVRQAVRDFLLAWRADPIRQKPGQLAELHSYYRGVERIAYGRPRRADPVYKNTSLTKVASIQATFDTTDDAFYGTTRTYADVTLIGNDRGGLVAPLKAPLATTGSSDRSVRVTLDTEIPAWPVITITGGQISNPVVEVLGQWRIGLLTSLAYDDTVVVDTRPWMRTILKNGSSIAGTLDPNSSRLSRCATSSGNLEVSFTGASRTATVSARIEWRSGYATL